MAKNTRGGRSQGGGFGKVLLGFTLGAAAVGGGGYVYLHRDTLLHQSTRQSHAAQPANDFSRSAPAEKRAGKPIEPHPAHETRTPPFGTSEDVFEAGAHAYQKNCASCHGTPGHDVASAAHMNPPALQLWKRRSAHAVGVSEETPGDIYGKVAYGVHASGMPAYEHVLTSTQIWQVSLLLANANTELPDPVRQILTAP